jgi:hypothetical protein
VKTERVRGGHDLENQSFARVFDNRENRFTVVLDAAITIATTARHGRARARKNATARIP